MPRGVGTSVTDMLRATLQPLTGHAGDYDPLLDANGEARVVCLGEATHGDGDGDGDGDVYGDGSGGRGLTRGRAAW